MSSHTGDPFRPAGTCGWAAPLGSRSAAMGPVRPVMSFPPNVALCRLGDHAAGEVVHHDRGIEPRERRLGAIEFFDPLAPFAAIDPFRRLARLPQIDAAGNASVLGADVVLPDQAREVLVLRRARLEP